MSDILYYALALIALPLGSILVVWYAGWDLDRQLKSGREKRLHH
ncbi:hypothetical protein [Aureimonas leprariae]|nr:hypothetical protein [Aureimonas leprariae]